MKVPDEVELYKDILDREIIPFLTEMGLIKAELELIGALLFMKYRGEWISLDKNLNDTAKLIKEVDELLKFIKNKNNETTNSQ